MEQLSFLPDVAAKPIKSKQTTQQLSLIPPTAYMKRSKAIPKVAKKESLVSYEGKQGTVIRNFSEYFDELTIDICRVEFEDGTIIDVLKKHLTFL